MFLEWSTGSLFSYSSSWQSPFKLTWLWHIYFLTCWYKCIPSTTRFDAMPELILDRREVLLLFVHLKIKPPFATQSSNSKINSFLQEEQTTFLEDKFLVLNGFTSLLRFQLKVVLCELHIASLSFKILISVNVNVCCLFRNLSDV